jgi:hypothetical protein
MLGVLLVIGLPLAYRRYYALSWDCLKPSVCREAVPGIVDIVYWLSVESLPLPRADLGTFK